MQETKRILNTKIETNSEYQYDSEEEQWQTSKKSDKKELPKKPTKDDLNSVKQNKYRVFIH